MSRRKGLKRVKRAKVRREVRERVKLSDEEKRVRQREYQRRYRERTKGRVKVKKKKEPSYKYRIPKPKKKPYSLASLYPHRITKKTRARQPARGRHYKWLGPFPNPLGMNEIFRIQLSRYGRQLLFERKSVIGRTRLAEQKRHIQLAMIFFCIQKLNELQADIQEYGGILIGKLVPLRSGKLRKVMNKSLKKNESVMPRPSKMELRMFLSADVPYAGAVDQMPTHGSPHVRHEKSIYKQFPKGIDPDAVGRYYYRVLRDLKSRFKMLWRGFLYELKNGFKKIFKDDEATAIAHANFLFKVDVEGRHPYWVTKGWTI